MNPDDLVDSWNRFLWQKEFVKNYRVPFSLSNGNEPPSLITDQILPELIYIRLVSILDSALSYYIDNNELQMPRKYKKDLHGRINFLDGSNTLRNFKDALHKIRDKRNEIGHSRSVGFADSEKTTTWNEVDSAIDVVYDELQNMKLVRNKPEYKFFGERSQFKESNESGIFGTHDYEIGVTLDGKRKAVQSWSEKILDD